MLDLTTIGGKLYEIKLMSGEVLQLKRPTQKMYEAIIELGKQQDGKDVSATLDAAMDMFTRILNRNNTNRTFTREELEADYDFTVALMVLGDYMNFYAQEIEKNVNFQRAQ